MQSVLNKVVYADTLVACGWAGAEISLYKPQNSKQWPTDGSTLHLVESRSIDKKGAESFKLVPISALATKRQLVTLADRRTDRKTDRRADRPFYRDAKHLQNRAEIFKLVPVAVKATKRQLVTRADRRTDRKTDKRVDRPFYRHAKYLQKRSR